MSLSVPQNFTENGFLKISIYYSLGGINLFTYKNERRGYYISVNPVTKKGIMESSKLMGGYKLLLVECKRRSKKAEKLAEEKAVEVEGKLIQAVLAENGLELAEEE